MINEREINELLKLKIEDMKKLDLMEDEHQFAVDIKEPEEISSDLKKIIKNVPQGEAGLNFLNDSKIVQDTEKELLDTVNSEFEKNPYKHTFAQLHAKERNPRYKMQVEEQYKVSLRQITNLYQQLKFGKPISYQGIARIVIPFVDYLEEDRAIIQNLATYYVDEDDYLFNHLTRVCLFSINIAAFYGLSKEEVLEVGIAALLADIGMFLIDPKIRTKRGRLTEQEHYEVQKHPILGLYAIEKIKGLPPRVKFVAYQHHERNSGLGYPKRRKSNLIHLYSKIVSVADVFEALASCRTYRIPFNPADAIDKIIRMAGMNLLDEEVVKCFINCVSLYPVGSLVKLTDNSIAKVVATNADNITLPVVAIIIDSNGRYIVENEIMEFNLAKMPSIGIVKAMDMNTKLNELMLGF